MLRYVPVGSKLLVEPFVPEERTRGGVILPSTAQTEQSIGTVVAAGQDCQDFGPGTHVLFVSFAGQTVQTDEKRYLVLDREDILARVYPDDSDSGQPVQPTQPSL